MARRQAVRLSLAGESPSHSAAPSTGSCENLCLPCPLYHWSGGDWSLPQNRPGRVLAVALAFRS